MIFLQLVKKLHQLEINEGSEISEELIATKLHPPPVEKKEAFSRPKAAGKGPRRLIRK